MPALATVALLALAEPADPTIAELLARGLAIVERRTVSNPYAGIRREELVLERPGERWRCTRWSDGTARCAPAAPEGG
jgi:hypothetical protein